MRARPEKPRREKSPLRGRAPGAPPGRACAERKPPRSESRSRSGGAPGGDATPPSSKPAVDASATSDTAVDAGVAPSALMRASAYGTLL